MTQDPTNGKASRAVVGQAPFQLTLFQAALLLVLETGSILAKTIGEQAWEIFQHRPQWIRVTKANLDEAGFVFSARSTRLGCIAAKRALNQGKTANSTKAVAAFTDAASEHARLYADWVRETDPDQKAELYAQTISALEELEEQYISALVTTAAARGSE